MRLLQIEVALYMGEGMAGRGVFVSVMMVWEV